MTTKATAREGPSLSVVVPLYNEVAAVGALVEAVRDALAAHPSWELLLVNDGSTDGTGEQIDRLGRDHPRVRPIHLARNFGQTAAMQAGFDLARGDVVVSMDGDLQNDPRDIPRLVDTLEDGYDLVAGYRENRQDRLVTRKVPSWVANRIIRRLTGVPIRDNGCSLKAYRRELLDRVHLYSDMHRFIPALAAATGGARIAEVSVRHHPRRFGTSKYGLSRVGKVLADLLVIKMIRSFRERPLALFGGAAVFVGLVALFLGAVAGAALLWVDTETAQTLVLPTTALAVLGLSFYLLMLGLVAEVALRKHRRHHQQTLPVVQEGAH